MVAKTALAMTKEPLGFLSKKATLKVFWNDSGKRLQYFIENIRQGCLSNFSLVQSSEE